MSQLPPLLDTLQQVVAHRSTKGRAVFHLDEPLPSSAPDFFSNDYLSLSADQSMRDHFLRRVQEASPTRLFGSTGSRLLTGNSLEYNALETAFKQFFGAPSALLCSSGFSANSTFLSYVPRKNDIIIYDELIHASFGEAIRSSSTASYWFNHNSVVSFEECLLDALQKHPQITQGPSTLFIVVESLYSMDGDFCPLKEIIDVVETLVPAGHAHIVVDEAHTSGICGPNGTGYVAHLGLKDRVDTIVHTFGKAWGFHGAVLLCSPIIRNYLINYGKSVKYSTAIPYTDLYALEACLSVVSSAHGQELRERLHRLTHYAQEKFSMTLKNVSQSVLALQPDSSVVAPDRAFSSPIIPVFTPHATRLADYLVRRGYAVVPMTYPFVKTTPRIRVIIHVGNTEEEIDTLANELLDWAARESVASCMPDSGDGGKGTTAWYAEAGEIL